jgi:hypothetical protein
MRRKCADLETAKDVPGWFVAADGGSDRALRIAAPVLPKRSVREAERTAFWNEKARPRGRARYGVPVVA